MTKINNLILSSFLFVTSLQAEIPESFFLALGKIESNNNDYAVGDNGKAISRYQIHYVCYLDAKEYDKSISFPYQSLTNRVNAYRVAKSYILKYESTAFKNQNWEICSRLWNSGPNWRYKYHLTNKYWTKFKKALDEKQSKP